MSDRFISSGVIEGQNSSIPSIPAPSSYKSLNKNQEVWDKVQKEIASERAARAAAHDATLNGSGKSLYETLQANKAAKQAAIEEANRLSNQFKGLDEDDIDFLERVRKQKEVQEKQAQAEIQNGLQAFREAQKKNGEDKLIDDTEEVEWAVGKKKRKAKPSLLRNVKRKVGDGPNKDIKHSGDITTKTGTSSSGAESKQTPKSKVTSGDEAEQVKDIKDTVQKEEFKPKPKLLVADYGSDSD